MSIREELAEDADDLKYYREEKEAKALIYSCGVLEITKDLDDENKILIKAKDIYQDNDNRSYEYGMASLNIDEFIDMVLTLDKYLKILPKRRKRKYNQQ